MTTYYPSPGNGLMSYSWLLTDALWLSVDGMRITARNGQGRMATLTVVADPASPLGPEILVNGQSADLGDAYPQYLGLVDAAYSGTQYLAPEES